MNQAYLAYVLEPGNDIEYISSSYVILWTLLAFHVTLVTIDGLLSLEGHMRLAMTTFTL